MDENSGAVVRENWPLWTTLFIAAASLLGRFLLVHLLARAGGPEPFTRQPGHTVAGARSPALFIEHIEATGPQTIVLTHGQGMDTTYWGPIRAQLGERFRVVAWDLPGLGVQSARRKTRSVSMTPQLNSKWW